MSKMVFYFYNGYTMELQNEVYAKQSSLPQLTSKMVVARRQAIDSNNVLVPALYVKIFHHVNNGTECQCYKCAPRELARVAKSIQEAWNPVWFGAVPYLQALYSLTRVTDVYGLDSAESIVLYFLSNASTWKGPIAKTIKQELNYYLKQAK